MARAGTVVALAGAFSLALTGAPGLAQDEEAESPSPTPKTKPVPVNKASRPVRVRVPALEIDLPVIASDRRVAGNPPGYPLCDVAQYLRNPDHELVFPGRPGTAWIYAHAQPGMFLPMTETYFAQGRAGLLGKLIKLQLRDGRLLTYRISQVRVAHDYDIAERPNERQQRLVLQTSTGTTGASPRLMVAGRLIDAEWTDEPRPEPEPRACWQPTPKPTPRGNRNNRNNRTPVPTPAPVIEPDDPVDPMTLVGGSVAVLLGATVVAVYVVRRS
jgi:hypothetical protein